MLFRSPSQRDWSGPATQLLAAVDTGKSRDLRALTDQLAAASGIEPEQWGWLARRLVQEELLHESDDGAQRLWLRPVARGYLSEPWPLHWAS